MNPFLPPSAQTSSYMEALKRRRGRGGKKVFRIGRRRRKEKGKGKEKESDKVPCGVGGDDDYTFL